MRIVKALGDAFRKGAGLQVYGPGGSTRSTRMQRLIQPGSRFDYSVEAGQLYDNGVVLPAINWKAGALSEAELIVQEFDQAANKWVRANEKGDAGGSVKRLLRAFDIPNDYYDGMTLWHGVQLSWDVRGNSYLYKRRDNIGRVIGFYWIPHTQIRPLADVDNPNGTRLVTRYEYIPLNGAMQYLAPEDVIHLRYGIDPRDPASGLSPLAAELRDICADNEVANWLASLLRQGGTPGAILVPKEATDTPTPEQRSALESLWNSFVGDKRGQAFALPLPVEVVTPTWSPEQMDLAPLRDVGMVRIMAALGLDPMVLGFSAEKQTFANKEQAIDDAGKRTILPTARRWARQSGQSVLRDFQLDPDKYRLWWDVSGVSWLIDDVDALHLRVRSDFQANIIDLWMAKEMLGLEPQEEDKGVYAWMLKPTPAAPSTAEPDKEEAKKHLSRVKRSHEALKKLGY